MSKIRAAVLAAIFIIISLLLIRFILEFSQYTQPSIISTILLIPTDFIAIFFRFIKIGSIEVSTIAAILLFLFVGYLSSKIITALEREDEDSTILEIIEAVLRTVEFLIIMRLLLKFIGAEASESSFASLLYFLTDWTSFLIRPLDLVFGVLDISSAIMLLIFILLDINTEVILRAVKFIKAGSSKSVDFVSNQVQNIKNNQEESSPDQAAQETPSTQPFTQTTPLPEQQIPQPPSQPTESAPQTVVINVPTDVQTPPVIKVTGEGVKIEPADSITSPETQHKDDKTMPEG